MFNDLAKLQYEEQNLPPLTDGFRPLLTEYGSISPIFRFYDDATENATFTSQGLQDQYWYSGLSGRMSRDGIRIVAKPGATVLAEHPTDDKDGKKAPLLVTGRYGAGHTLFAAYDESWRRRFYTGETHFDTYWLGQLRYLAQGRKHGRQPAQLTAEYNKDERRVRMTVRILDTVVGKGLPEELNVAVVDVKTKARVYLGKMLRSANQDSYAVSFAPDQDGEFRVELLDAALREVPAADITVARPDPEFKSPGVDGLALKALADNTDGSVLNIKNVQSLLPDRLPSLHKALKTGIGPNDPMYMFSNMPLVLIVLILLLTLEWVVRKVCGML